MCDLRHIVESELGDFKDKKDEKEDELDLCEPAGLSELSDSREGIADYYQHEAH